ncbi:MAG TPA: hypothetical protein VEL82_06160 [Thermoplasmata archaeon]|nr:hypothetical protein [Thermoplasmata archaeon]
MGELVSLVIDPLRGERVSLELPLTSRTSPEAARAEVGLPDWVDVADPIVARAVMLLGAARRADPPVSLAVLGGAAHRLRCPSSQRSELGLRRALHDLDLACLHKELRAVRRLLETAHEREGSALRIFETSGDRIFNSLSEGRRLRYHMVLGQDGPNVAVGSVDLLADEFRFCHRIDLRDDVRRAPEQHGTLTPALLLLAKLQYIQRVPDTARGPVADRFLEPFGRHEILIGPEAKDVRDVLALLLDHPIDESADGISPRRIDELLRKDFGFWRTVSLNAGLLLRSPLLAALPEVERAKARAQVDDLVRRLGGIVPKRRLGLLGGPWWEEVDALPAVDGTATVSTGP